MIADIDSYLREFTFRENRHSVNFDGNAGKTRVEKEPVYGTCINRYINEFWTSRQRQASALHEIAYRACFKPQLPRFFIELLTNRGDLIYDPFAGRGTTAVEAGLLGRRVMANDVNPLSVILTRPRFDIPESREIAERLDRIKIDVSAEAGIDLSMFYHIRTEAEICSLRDYLRERKEAGREDALDAWIRMVATNRLTGHSRGFFSVYTLPPNQAVSPESQRRINEKKGQIPDYRNVKELILKKSRQLVSGLSETQKRDMGEIGRKAIFLNVDSRLTREIQNGVVQLTVTSPPFLNVVQYTEDNWLRYWFNSIDAGEIAGKIVMARTLADWSNFIGEVFQELYRITKRGGWVVFEVGEIKGGKINLDEYVVPLGLEAGFDCKGIIINEQDFTKTSNIWGIRNNRRGTNTNRIVLFKKE
ncbi:DNA methyltransferase [Chloroflexota bacterium]